MTLNALFDFLILKGGPGSGNWGHAGKPGRRGGSAPKSGVGAVMSLRTGPTAEKRRLEAKGVSQQKVSSGTPVSSALNLDKLPQKGKLSSDIKEVVGIVDKIHGDGDLPATTMITNSTKSYWGRYYPGENKISVSSKTSHPMITTAHEMGHLIDYKGFGKRGTLGNPEVNKVIDVIKNSRAYKNLGVQKGKDLQHTYTDPDGKTHTYTSKPDRKYLSYLQRPDESFARAYSQYVTVKSNNPKMKTELDSIRQRNSYTPQWNDDDFKPIEKAFDNLFTNKGWMK